MISPIVHSGGLIDGFFNANLRQFVDVSKNPWIWQKVDISNSAFRKRPFSTSNAPPGSATTCSPAANLASASRSYDKPRREIDRGVLEVDGQTTSYDHGPPRPIKMTWPGPSAVGHVRIAFSPPSPGEATTMRKTASGHGSACSRKARSSSRAERIAISRPSRSGSAVQHSRSAPIASSTRSDRTNWSFPLSAEAVTVTAEAAGFYGKLAARGDFVTRRLGRSFTETWDKWLREGILTSRTLSLRVGWTPT